MPAKRWNSKVKSWRDRFWLNEQYSASCYKQHLEDLKSLPKSKIFNSGFQSSRLLEISRATWGGATKWSGYSYLQRYQTLKSRCKLETKSHNRSVVPSQLLGCSTHGGQTVWMSLVWQLYWQLGICDQIVHTRCLWSESSDGNSSQWIKMLMATTDLASLIYDFCDLVCWVGTKSRNPQVEF